MPGSERFLAGAAAAITMLLAQPVSAAVADIRFYSSQACDPRHGYRFGADSEVELRANCTYGSTCENDSFRSMWIAPTVKPGTIIKVWDDSKASGRDDWAQIIIKAVIPSQSGSQGGKRGMCVDTFEQNRSGADYSIYYHRVDNLDGKISLIQVTPVPEVKQPVKGHH